MKFARIRIIGFGCGVIAALLSLSLIVGSYLRTVGTTDYLEQAKEGTPWVVSGLLFSLTAILLCSLGRKWWRGAGIAISSLLFVWWVCQAGALL